MGGFKFYNTNGDELFSDVENVTNLAEHESVDEKLPRSASVTSPSADNAAPGQHQSQSLRSLLTIDVDLSTILEEQEDEDIHDCPITEEHTTIDVNQKITPGVSFTDDSSLTLPHTHVPIVSQTRPDDEEHPFSDDNDDDGINEVMLEEGTNIDDMAAHINGKLGETDDVLSAELHSIVDHRYLSGIIELQVK